MSIRINVTYGCDNDCDCTSGGLSYLNEDNPDLPDGWMWQYYKFASQEFMDSNIEFSAGRPWGAVTCKLWCKTCVQKHLDKMTR